MTAPEAAAMPLLDHFHGPLKPFWPGFHGTWMSALAAGLNEYLPPRYVAEPSARFGIEVDVGALERIEEEAREANGTAWQPSWVAPAATATVPFAIATDALEVLVSEDYPGEWRLVGAVEFVSQANKDRPETRDAFVSKCHGYLQRGVGVMIVDVVTDRHANLHNELVARLGCPEQAMDGHLYAVAYRPTGKNGTGRLDLWPESLSIGATLPTLPLWLFGGIEVPARLEEAYARACKDLKVYERIAIRRRADTPSNG